MGLAFARKLKQHWTSKHGIMVPKKSFKTLDEAVAFCEEHYKSKPQYHPYICADCGQWHIGHSKPKKKKK